MRFSIPGVFFQDGDYCSRLALDATNPNVLQLSMRSDSNHYEFRLKQDLDACAVIIDHSGPFFYFWNRSNQSLERVSRQMAVNNGEITTVAYQWHGINGQGILYALTKHLDIPNEKLESFFLKYDRLQIEQVQEYLHLDKLEQDECFPFRFPWPTSQVAMLLDSLHWNDWPRAICLLSAHGAIFPFATDIMQYQSLLDSAEKYLALFSALPTRHLPDSFFKDYCIKYIYNAADLSKAMCLLEAMNENDAARQTLFVLQAKRDLQIAQEVFFSFSNEATALIKNYRRLIHNTPIEKTFFNELTVAQCTLALQMYAEAPHLLDLNETIHKMNKKGFGRHLAKILFNISSKLTPPQVLTLYGKLGNDLVKTIMLQGNAVDLLNLYDPGVHRNFFFNWSVDEVKTILLNSDGSEIHTLCKKLPEKLRGPYEWMWELAPNHVVSQALITLDQDDIDAIVSRGNARAAANLINTLRQRTPIMPSNRIISTVALRSDGSDIAELCGALWDHPQCVTNLIDTLSKGGIHQIAIQGNIDDFAKMYFSLEGEDAKKFFEKISVQTWQWLAEESRLTLQGFKKHLIDFQIQRQKVETLLQTIGGLQAKFDHQMGMMNLKLRNTLWSERFFSFEKLKSQYHALIAQLVTLKPFLELGLARQHSCILKDLKFHWIQNEYQYRELHKAPNFETQRIFNPIEQKEWTALTVHDKLSLLLDFVAENQQEWPLELERDDVDEYRVEEIPGVTSKILAYYCCPGLQGQLFSLTPLMIAAATDNWVVTRLLLEQGADLNYETRDGNSALIMCAKYAHHTKSLDSLLEKIDKSKMPHRSPCFEASTNTAAINPEALLERLIANGFDPCQLDPTTQQGALEYVLCNTRNIPVITQLVNCPRVQDSFFQKPEMMPKIAENLSDRVNEGSSSLETTQVIIDLLNTRLKIPLGKKFRLVEQYTAFPPWYFNSKVVCEMPFQAPATQAQAVATPPADLSTKSDAPFLTLNNSAFFAAALLSLFVFAAADYYTHSLSELLGGWFAENAGSKLPSLLSGCIFGAGPVVVIGASGGLAYAKTKW